MTPDALLKVWTPGRPAVRKYVFDAKFRDYASQDDQLRRYEAGDRNEEPYLYSEARHYGGYAAADRLGTIRDKYLRIEGVVAGFIIHSDTGPGFEVWDDAFDRESEAAAVEGQPHVSFRFRGCRVGRSSNSKSRRCSPASSDSMRASVMCAGDAESRVRLLTLR